MKCSEFAYLMFRWGLLSFWASQLRMSKLVRDAAIIPCEEQRLTVEVMVIVEGMVTMGLQAMAFEPVVMRAGILLIIIMLVIVPAVTTPVFRLFAAGATTGSTVLMDHSHPVTVR